MKKALLVPALFLFLFVTPRNIYAGPQCNNLGGKCKTSCLSTEVNRGLQDCTPNPKGPSERCCVLVSGQGPQGGPQGGIDTSDVAKLSDLEAVFGNVVSAALALGGIVFFIMLISGGFKYITSGGDPKAVEEAKKTLTYAIGGMVLLALAFLLLRFIEVFTGAEVTKFKIFQ